MVFKSFRIKVITRIALLSAAIALLAWCLATGHYLRSFYAGAALVGIIIELFWYIDRFNRDVNNFLLSLMQRDFTTRFQATGRSQTFDELYGTLNRISDLFKSISTEKEVQYRFLEMLVEHIRVGIITFDEDGKITLVNQSAKNLFRKDVLFSLKSLESFGPELVETMRSIRSSETRLHKLRIGDEVLQLSIHAAEFRIGDRSHKLLSLQNIRSELDAREMEAWQKLIRVLTHEIMNSVSPIISLSETMHNLVLQPRTDMANVFETLEKGIDAIRVRSQGLYTFTQSYRKLTGIPKLQLEPISTRDLITHVAVLLEGTFVEKGIKVTTQSADITVLADRALIEQVLINLLHNAIDAVSRTTSPSITVGARQDNDGGAVIFVRDNGEGIDEQTAEKIFIPFFTTRKHGSGIGLALVRQILHLHYAQITFKSEKGSGSEFMISL